MVGKTVSHYRIVEELGSGGMGVVYKAQDTRLDRFVALKFLPPHLSQDEEGKKRFIHEAKAASALDHSNICTIYEIDETEDGQMFIAMACYEGESLKQRIGREPLPIDEAVDVAIQVAQGLSKAHAKKIIHRDIKPANILMTEDGQVKIVDFGLAKLAGGTMLTREGTTMGTVAYMSPEQARGEPVDQRTDIWSLGVVFYQCLTGELPFKGEFEQALLYSILHEEPEPVRTLRPDLPPGVDPIMRRVLSKDPEARYQRVEDFLQDLERLRTGKRLQKQGPILPATHLPRVPVKIAVTVLMMAVLLVAGLFIASDSDSPRPLPPKHSQLTFLGDANLPAISPDGEFIAYTRSIVASMDARKVFVQGIGGGRAIEVFEVDGGIWDISWSPDGSELLIAANVDGTRAVFLVPRLGGTVRRFPLRSVYTAWSPDGKRFATRTSDTTITITDKSTGSSGSIPLDRTHFKPLERPMPGIGMDWSPTGEWIVLGRWDEDGAVLWTVSLDGKKLNRIVEHPEGVFSPRWSPRGDAVYYMKSTGGGPPELWKVPVNPRTGKAKGEPRFVLGGIRFGQFSLARDGKRLLYVRHSSQSNLWLIRPDGSDKSEKVTTRQITWGTVVDLWPTVSPDGSRVAFDRDMGQSTHIFVMPIEGGEPQQLTFSRSLNVNPAWSSDGKAIAFHTHVDEKERIGIINVDGSGERVFAKSQPAGAFVSWAPGPGIVYVGANTKRLHILDPVSEEETVFPEEPWPDRIGSGWLSPDGKRLAFYVYGTQQKGLMVASLETGEWKTVHERLGFLMGWTADGTGLYVRGDTPEGSPAIFLIPENGGATRLVARLPFTSKELGACAATADGSAFVCSLFKRQSDIWLVENFDPDVR